MIVYYVFFNLFLILNIYSNIDSLF